MIFDNIQFIIFIQNYTFILIFNYIIILFMLIQAFFDFDRLFVYHYNMSS